MTGNILAGDFLAHAVSLGTLWPKTVWPETFWADTFKNIESVSPITDTLIYAVC